MSPQLALKVLLFLLALVSVSFFLFYKTQQEFNATTLNNLEHQLEIDKKIKEAEDILGESSEKKTLEEKSKELINKDLKSYNTIKPETVDKIIDLANIEIRRKNGLPPN